LLEQARSDPAPLEVVGHDESALGRCWIPEPHVTGQRDDSAAQLTDEVALLAPIGLKKRGNELLAHRRKAVKAVVEALL
jgi:hypothetical protein